MWISSIYKNIGSSSVQKILVGNKLDLIQKSQDFVQHQEALKMAEEHKMDYFQTSAVQGDNVDIVINDIIRKVYHTRFNEGPPQEMMNTEGTVQL